MRNGFTLRGGGRVYLAKYPTDNFHNPWMFWQVPLLGKHFSYEVDVSNVGCHCNAAAYFVQMPGHDWNHNPKPGPTVPLTETITEYFHLMCGWRLQQYYPSTGIHTLE